MGVYKISAKDLAQSLALDLDEKEGDFDTKTLHQALRLLRKYPYTCDKDDMYAEDNWREFMGS